MHRVAAWFLLVLLLLSACTPAAPLPAAETTSATALPAPSATPLPTASPTPAPTASPTPRSVEPISAANALQVGLAGPLGYGSIYNAAYLPDGRLLVSFANGIYIYSADLQTASLLHAGMIADTLRTPRQGQHAALQQRNAAQIVLPALEETAAEISVAYDAHDPYAHFLFSPDGSRLILVSSKYLTLFDAASGKQTRVLQHPDNCAAVQITPDGKSLACFSVTMAGQSLLKMLKVTDLESGETTASFQPTLGYVNQVAFTPDGKMLLLNGLSIQIHPSAASPDIIATLQGDMMMEQIAVSPDGKLLAAAGGDQIALWDLASSSKHSSIETIGGSVSFSPDGAQLMVWNQGALALFSVPELALQAVLPGSSPSPTLLFSPEGNLYQLTHSTAAQWSVGGQSLLQTSLLGPGVRSAATLLSNLDEDHKISELYKDKAHLLLTNEKGSEYGSFDLKVIDGDTLEPLGPLFGLNAPFTALSFSADHNLAAFGMADGQIALIDLKKAANLDFTGRHNGAILSIAVSSDRATLLTRSADQTGILWDIKTSTALKMINFAGAGVGFTALDPNGKWFALGDELSLHVFGPAGAEEVEIPCQDCRAAAFSPDGSLLAFADGDEIHLRAAQNAGEALAVLPRPDERPARESYDAAGKAYKSTAVSRLAFSEDGKWLASGSLDGMVYLWNTAGEIVQTAAALPDAQPAAAQGAPSQAFGSPLPAGQETLTVQNVSQLQELGRWGEKGILQQIHFAPDGKSLLAVTSLGVYRLNPARPEEIQPFGDPGFYRDALVRADGSVIALAAEDVRMFYFRADGSAEREEEFNLPGVNLVDPQGLFHVNFFNGTVTLRPLAGGETRGFTTQLSLSAYLHLAPGAKYAAVTSDYQGSVELELWDTEQALKTLSFQQSGAGLGRLAFSPDGKLFAAELVDRKLATSTIQVWDTESGKLRVSFPLSSKSSAIGLQFTPDNATLLVGPNTEPGSVDSYSLADGALLRSLPTLRAVFLGVSPDGKQLAVSDGRKIQLLDLESGQPLGEAGGFSGQAGAFQQAAGGELFLLQPGYGCRLYDIGAQKVVFEKTYGSCALTPDGLSLIENNSRAILLYSLPDLSLEREIEKNDSYEQLAFSADGGLLAAATSVYRWQGIGIFDLNGGTLVKTLALEQTPLVAFDLSADGKRIAGVTQDTLYLWDVESEENIVEQLIGEDRLVGVKFLPDGRVLVLSLGGIEIWGGDPFALQQVIPHPGGNGYALSQGNILAVADLFGGVTLIDLAAAVEIGKLDFAGRVSRIGFSQDEKLLIFTPNDGTLRFWGVP